MYNRKDFVFIYFFGMLFFCQQNVYFFVQQQKFLDDFCMVCYQFFDNYCFYLQLYDFFQEGGDIFDWYFYLNFLYCVIFFFYCFVYFVEFEIEVMCLMVWLLGFKDVSKWFGVYFLVCLLL